LEREKVIHFIEEGLSSVFLRRCRRESVPGGAELAAARHPPSLSATPTARVPRSRSTPRLREDRRGLLSNGHPHALTVVDAFRPGRSIITVMPLHRQVLLGVVVIVAMISGCDNQTQATRPATAAASAPAKATSNMKFTVEEVFYIKPPVDRVILVGTITDGVVRVGDKLVVHTSAGPVNVSVDRIDSIQQGELKQPSKGQQVGLRLTGIREDQPSRGDRVTAAGGA
jgi:hypothetical protein